MRAVSRASSFSEPEEAEPGAVAGRSEDTVVALVASKNTMSSSERESSILMIAIARWIFPFLNAMTAFAVDIISDLVRVRVAIGTTVSVCTKLKI